jgi:hypothetical protein
MKGSAEVNSGRNRERSQRPRKREKAKKERGVEIREEEEGLGDFSSLLGCARMCLGERPM